MLPFRPMHQPQRRILPLDKPRIRFRCGNFLPSGCDLQRRPRPLLRRSPGRSEGNHCRSRRCCASASKSLGWQVHEQLEPSRPQGEDRVGSQMAAHYGIQALVLGMCWSPLGCDLGLAADLRSGAMGCGAYDCPPRPVAEEIKAVPFDEGFVGWFREVIFAVYPAGRTGKTNYDVFKEAFETSES